MAACAVQRGYRRRFLEIQEGWCTDAALSDWYGVKVSDGRVVELDLKFNHLRGPIPEQLGQLGALTVLDLSMNQLEGPIPKKLGHLEALTILDLSYNELEGSIPEELGQLGTLTALFLHENKLEGEREAPEVLRGSIPKELGLLGALEKMFLSSNKLQGPIPKELGQLGALTTLNLCDNELEGSIPKELGLLGALENLYLSSNKLQGSIPEELGQLDALTTLNLFNNMLEGDKEVSYERPAFSGNPWKEPPGDVVIQGLNAVIRYWQDAERYGRRFSNRLKVVLVGLGSAGKTSLASRLEGRDGDSLPGEEERTVGVEIRDIYLEPSPVSHSQHSGQDLAVKLWDFAGQRAYYDTHQIFLTKDALYILVVDTSTYRVKHTAEEAIEQWIDILQSRVPGAVILLVGTHKDAFLNADERDERMKMLHQDVENCNSRLREELEARRHRHGMQMVRVVNGHDVLLLDCKSSGEDEIHHIRSLIATVAYSRDYSFPSVESQIPTPWVYVFLTLEAVRRGADLRGISGEMAVVLHRLEQGDPKASKFYIFFNDALALFKHLWKAMGIENTRPPSEMADKVFHNAVDLNETQGWILLTNTDESMDDKCDGQVSRGHLVHVDPARFADVVRRVVDIRLMDPASKLKIKDALGRFARKKRISHYELAKQQWRFYVAGEVSKHYLQFLWCHRELDLGQAAKEASPLAMAEEDVDAMVSSLVDLRMMFPVRNYAGGVIPDLYMVGPGLPDHLTSRVTTKSCLELAIGSAMFRLTLQIHGSRLMPPGLIPRLLAWCGRGKGRIIACWRRGAIFTYDKHLLLIHELRTSEKESSLVCCSKGDANTEVAGRVLEYVAEEVRRLIRDPWYGFPGIELSTNDRIEKYIVGQADDLEKLLQKLEKDLEDHTNLRLAELVKQSERIAHGVNAYLHAEVGAFEGRLEGILRELDITAAFAGKCLLPSTKDDCPCPRLVWVEEDLQSSEQPQPGQRFGHFRKVRWVERRKTFGTRFRVRFLCAHDLSLVACGADGNGYVLEKKDWQRWLQKCFPVLQLSLWILRAGISSISRVDLLPMGDMLATLKEIAGEDVANNMEELELRGATQSDLDKQVEVYGKAYKNLVEFMEKEENQNAKTTRVVRSTTSSREPSAIASLIARRISSWCSRGHLARQRTAGSTVPTYKRSFEEDMVYVNRVVSSTEVESAWVHKNNKNAWEANI